MVITIDLATLVTVGSALAVAGGAVLWASRKLNALQRLDGLTKRVDGDSAATDPRERDGHEGRLADVEQTVAIHESRWHALTRALRLPSISDEHLIREAVRQAIAEGRITVADTGTHPTVQLPPLPPPAPVLRHPTPHRGPPIPRDDDEE